MADLLGATNPVPGYDPAATRAVPISPNDTQIQNIPDPSRVGRPDARTDQQDAAKPGENAVPKFGSNFQSFLQRLRDTPDLTQTMVRLIFGRQGTVVTSNLSSGLAVDLSRFLEMLKLNESQFTQFLSTQLGSANRFGGALFSLLRQAYQSTDLESMKGDILQFAKRFGDFSSTGHIEGNLLRNLQQTAQHMPASWANKLIDLTARLQNGIAAGDRAGNLKLLQGEILPYLKSYCERTNDMGTPRELLRLLSLDISRYENGSEAGLIQDFRQLNNYSILKEKLGGLDDKTLIRLLRDSPFAKAAGENHFADQLAAATARALKGEGGADMQEVFRAIMNAFLINESVYMPLTHLIIPLDWNGQMMFSELWVDPDADRDESGKSGEDSPHTMRFLFKMDIQSLGLFDMVLTCQGERVDLQVACPELVAPFSSLVQGELTRILTENGLQAGAVQVTKLEKPLAISQVFPKLFQGRRSVDVRI